MSRLSKGRGDVLTIVSLPFFLLNRREKMKVPRTLAVMA